MALYLLKGPGIGKTVSITAVITLAVGLASLFGLLLLKRLKRNLGLNIFRAVIVGIIVIGTASAFIGGLVFGGELASSFGREETLTGRTAIWAELIPFAMREPIIWNKWLFYRCKEEGSHGRSSSRPQWISRYYS
jgi:hypothetical protein